MPKVVVTDHSFSPLDIETAILAPLGVAPESHQAKTPEALTPVVADADAVMVQFAPINAQVIGAMTRARVIVRYGIGVDNVDLAAARARGIPVCNVPDYCIDEVADHTLAFLLGLTRQVMPNCLKVRGGQWGLGGTLADMKTLRDLTTGIVGFGRIGRAVVRRLLAFGGPVRVFDPVVGAKEIAAAGAVPAATLDELLASSDVVSLHCPSTPATRRLMNEAAFTKLKPGALFLNLARGDLVDTAALVAALQSGRLAGAALDVCDPEPIPADHVLLTMPNVIVASHVASASARAVRTLRETVAGLVVKCLKGEPLQNVVNGVK